MFKLLLQRKLGLDFGTTVAGETNTKYFMFSVPRAKLNLVKGDENKEPSTGRTLAKV